MFKAISSSLAYNLEYKEIEIFNDKYEIPFVVIKKGELSDVNIKISLSHTDEFAIAFTILQYSNDKK